MSRPMQCPAGGRGEPASPQAGGRASACSRWQHSPLSLLILVAGSVFVVEGAIMWLLHRLPPLAPRTEGLLDAALLTAAVFPALYLFLFRPLTRSLTGLTQANQELAKGERALLNVLADLKASNVALQATQLQLIQAAKLESVGQLAAGVAHEVKNPLAIILQGLAYLSTSLPTDDDTIRSVLETMDRGARRADAVIKGLLDFSAPASLEPAPCEFNALVEQALQLVHHQLVTSRVTVVKELAESLPTLELDKGKIEQVFVNLFLNAIQAMPQGGTLTIRTSKTRLTEVGGYVGRRATDRFRPGEAVVVAQIEDTGTGIPAEVFGKIFEPFFTTKPVGQGSGLGLAVTRKILELHGAVITLANRQEGGVRVNIMFKRGGPHAGPEEANPGH